MTKDIDVKPVANDNFSIAKFKVVSLKKPKAVLVLVPGSSGDGRWMVKHPLFEDFMDDHNVALVGCYFSDPIPKIDEDYVDAKNGSGAALDQALEEAGLNDLPILLWGFSAGGEFNYEYACYNPDKVIGFVVNKGGVYYTALAPSKTRKIPALFFVGKNDASFRKAILSGLYLMNRTVDSECEWELVQEDCGHAEGRSLTISLDFFKKILKKA